MLRVNLDAPYFDWKGKTVTELVASEKGPVESTVTIGMLLLTCVSTPVEGDDAMGHVDKMRLFKLGQGVARGGVIDLTPEDVVFVAGRGAKNLNPLPYGRVYEVLYPTDEEMI